MFRGYKKSINSVPKFMKYVGSRGNVGNNSKIQ